VPQLNNQQEQPRTWATVDGTGVGVWFAGSAASKPRTSVAGGVDRVLGCQLADDGAAIGVQSNDRWPNVRISSAAAVRKSSHAG